MSTPGHWDGLYHRQIGHLLINYYDIDPHRGRKFVLINAYIPSQRHHDMSVVSVYDLYRVLLINAIATARYHVKRVPGTC